MKSSTIKDFRKRLNQLPVAVQEQANKAYALWKADLYHPSLQFKRMSPRQLIYSVRVSLNYRALGLLEKGHVY
ncbi:MAG: hypothetical protein AAGH67_04775 [Cyanobacteria bacterium P01_H01_bin.162]